jgi:hypothetical protein
MRFVLRVLLVIILSGAMFGCGGHSRESAKNQNLERFKPDFADPPWYNDYRSDPLAATRKYRERVLQLSVTFTEFQQGSLAVRLRGFTGARDEYRVVCLFPLSAGADLQNTRPRERLIVKGLFDQITARDGTYEISLRNCVVVR